MLEPHDPVVTVRAGGVAPLKSKLPESERASALTARAYTHPAIEGRVVVRLSPDAIAAGTDAEMQALGFDEPSIEESLGLSRYRTLGFPAWALVHDPKKARFALEVTQDFRKAKKKATSKPGHAKEAFEGIAKTLGRTVPHFLPSFWEEAGRVLADEGASAMAAQCFEKAREAERAHKLKVDEAARDAVFVEFALLGALSAKTLSTYAKELEKSAGAKDAYRRFRSIVVQRALGGMAPWSGMSKDVRALARAAKLDGDAEDDALVNELVDSPSLKRAPREFWESYRPSLVRIAKSSAHSRSRLRALFPEPRTSGDDGEEKFKLEWLAVLAECGAYDDIPDAELSDWLSKAIKFGGNIPPVRALIERFAERLKKLDTPLKVVVGGWWQQLSLDLCELALSLSIPLAEPKDEDGDAINFDDEYECDPVHVANDARYRERLVAFVAEHIGEGEHEGKMLGKQGFLAARRAWIEEQLDAVEKGGLHKAEEALSTLDQKTTAATFLPYPDLHERLARVKIAPALAKTLRAGLFDELGWPAYEEAATKLGDKLTVEGGFPHLVLHDGVRAMVLGPEGVALQHDFAIHAKNEELQHAFFLDGQMLVFLRDKKEYDDYGYWSGQPKERFKESLWIHVVPIVTSLEGSGVTWGGPRIRAGDTKIETARRYVYDGQTFFITEWQGDGWKTIEYDPRTDKKGRASKPTFFEQWIEEGTKFEFAHSSLHPLTAATSILGVREGLTGMRVRTRGKNEDRYECERIDGVKWEGDWAAEGLLLLPGDASPRPLTTGDHQDKRFRGEVPTVTIGAPDGEVIATSNEHAWAARGWGHVPLPPLAMWHFLSPRDEAGSRVLRAVDDARAEAWLAIAREEAAEEEGKPMPRTQAAIAGSGVAHQKLALGVAGVVEHAVTIERKLKELVTERSKEAAENVVQGGGEEAAAIRKLADALVKGKAIVIEDMPDVRDWLEGGRGKAVLACAPFAEASERTNARGMLSAFAGTLFEGELSSIRFVDLEEEDDREEDDLEWGALQVVKQDGSVFGLNPSGDWGIERTTDGQFRVPKGFKVEKDRRLAHGPGKEWIQAYLAMPDAPAPYVPEVADRIAEKTGLTKPEAILLAAFAPRVNQWGKDFLGKEIREKLGLKTNEADAARGTFKELEDGTLEKVFAAAVGDDPGCIHRPLEADATGRTFADKLADAWMQIVGRKVELPIELLTDAQKDLDLGDDLKRTFAAIVEPASAPFFHVEARSLPDVIWGRHQGPKPFGAEEGRNLARAIAWLNYTQPVGERVRSAIPAVVDKMRALLGDERMIWPFGCTYGDADDKKKKYAEALAVVGGDKASFPNDDDEVCEDGRDDGVFLVAIYDAKLMAGFRPARVKKWDDKKALALQKVIDDESDDGFGAARMLLSPELAALAARVRETPLKEGEFEANPLLSAPKIVSAVKKTHGVSEDAAALYLQLLALAEPTDRAVRRFNGWTPKQHQGALAELVKKKLVVEGKRERAGREAFLPGGFGKGEGRNLPMEDWKKSFYPDWLGRHLPLEPLHALFARAWKRVEGGDAPKYEKVR